VAEGDRYVASTFQFEARYPEAELYAQDTWKVKKNLTVDLGLRWEARFSPSDPQSRMLVPDQPIVAGAKPSNTIQWVPGDMFKNQLTNFGPSAGFAWDPFGDGKTSIRANYRMAFDRISTFLLARTAIYPNLPARQCVVAGRPSIVRIRSPCSKPAGPMMRSITGSAA
jgi:outer membrane receptor protein involved in Fe transport